MSTRTGLLRVLICTAVAVALPPAGQADEYGKGPAVSGFNTKFSGEGGIYDDEGAGLFQGSLTTPLGYAFGFQADGVVGTIDDETLGGGALHLFTRDPSSYLLGIYASYHSWDSIDIARVAAEGELYWGRVTLSGIAGWESIDVPETRNGLRVLTQDEDRFFTELDVAYYPKDDLRLSAGYHYENGQSLGAAEFEYMPRWTGVPMSFFATGRFGDDDVTRVTGGLKIYFGADPDKSLIRRHREDDPQTYNPVFPRIVTATPGGQATPSGGGENFCPVPASFAIADHPGCVCPDGLTKFEDDGIGVCADPDDIPL